MINASHFVKIFAVYKIQPRYPEYCKEFQSSYVTNHPEDNLSIDLDKITPAVLPQKESETNIKFAAKQCFKNNGKIM